MSSKKYGFYFSSDADQSPHDFTIYVQSSNDIEETVILAARYKNAERNHIYEMMLTADDLELFGQMCIDLSERMKRDHELRNACPECGGMLAHHEYCSMYVRKN